MYLRGVHTDLDLPTLYAFIQANPLGILTTSISSPGHHTIQSSHIPWVLDIPDPMPMSNPDPTSESTAKPPLGILRGHLARANPQAKALIHAATTTSSNTLQTEILILFNSPVHHYVTPKFYVETKPSTGKVVPTWDYSAVQVYGTATIHFDTASPTTDEFLSKQIADLSRQSEEGIFGFDGKEGRQGPWGVEDAPEKYIGLLKKAIMGIEVKVESVEGKFKMSQELGKGDREGTIKGFESVGTMVGEEVARCVRERGDLKDGVNV